MKRCPQCEFTFDDHEYICDFDNTELIHIPEPSSQTFSPPSTLMASFGLRLITSNFSLAILALTGIVLSALVVGYYSAIEVESKPETGGLLAAQASKAPAEVARFLPKSNHSAKSTVPTHQTHAKNFARLTQKGKFTAGLKRRPAKITNSTLLTSAAARRSEASGGKTGFRSSAHSSTIARRRNRKTDLDVRRSLDNSIRLVIAKQETRTDFAEPITRQHNAVSEENGRMTNGYSRWTGTNVREVQAGRNSQKLPEKKEAKVIAVLKKTARILARPFKF